MMRGAALFSGDVDSAFAFEHVVFQEEEFGYLFVGFCYFVVVFFESWGFPSSSWILQEMEISGKVFFES